MTTTRRRPRRRYWTPAEDAVLRRRYPDTPTVELARVFGRPVREVYSRAARLGLRKTEAYLESPAACRLRRGGDVGKATRFRPGQVPANKGLRRPGWHRGRMRETQFKPGARSGQAARHWQPIGSTRLIEGYVYRKVSDVPNVPYTVNWRPEHHLVWTAAHGPIPPGHALTFRNGDRADPRLENLALIHRRDLMRRNSIHQLPPELKAAVRLLGRVTRTIRRLDDGGQEQDQRPA